MNIPSNIVEFRLTGTPDGDLLITLYYLNVFDQDTVDWHIAGLFVEGRIHPIFLEYMPVLVWSPRN